MIRQILFDFDGVIVDSMTVRDYGFRTILGKYNPSLIDDFIRYHRHNGGLSRYVKIRYFFEVMLGESISEGQVYELALQFSKIMQEHLISPQIIIPETVDFIKKIYKKIPLHIVSGSDGAELNFLCLKLGLDSYFVTIEGSPTAKNDLVTQIMMKYRYDPKETLLIGDSINDQEAARLSGLYFVGFNNEFLKPISDLYVDVIDDRIFGLPLVGQ